MPCAASPRAPMPEPLDQGALDALREMTGGDDELYLELLDTFLSDVALYLGELDAAAAGGDVAALVRPAHSMKSNALNVGATELAERCRLLETDARHDAVADPVARVAEVRGALASAEAAVRAVRAEVAGGT